jgi:hypothetical protein
VAAGNTVVTPFAFGSRVKAGSKEPVATWPQSASQITLSPSRERSPEKPKTRNLFKFNRLCLDAGPAYECGSVGPDLAHVARRGSI